MRIPCRLKPSLASRKRPTGYRREKYPGRPAIQAAQSALSLLIIGKHSPDSVNSDYGLLPLYRRKSDIHGYRYSLEKRKNPKPVAHGREKVYGQLFSSSEGPRISVAEVRPPSTDVLHADSPAAGSGHVLSFFDPSTAATLLAEENMFTTFPPGKLVARFSACHLSRLLYTSTEQG